MKKLGYIIIALVFAACGSNTFQTEAGTTVTYLKKGNGEAPVDSLVSMFRIKYTTEEGEVMMDADEPMPLKIDPKNQIDQGELFNVLTQLTTGDSVEFALTASELFEKTFRAPRPDSIAADSKIQFQIAYVDQLTEEGYYEMIAKKAEEAAAKQIIIDNEILDNYLAENDIDAQQTESGLRYVIMEEGNGPKPEVGQKVSVNYTGWVLNGEYFDSSDKDVAMEKGLYDERREPYQPYTFPLGQGQVIKGWDEGIALLNEGTKARLYIPSPLGYGSRDRSPIIRANSILVFDVELVEVAE
ncbi:FKBP-type peptidyl-prolyl cis-trans isomerase [Ekhidna sp.]|jgi:FKBP-type peptidyl-prolyl cis-trans isomerase FkpA|uniref:FKBP-type peptidyl-prolyl cis-trans isomerase n=1 Tax=Ekhidna sp. TaxID=2608089 RepID=UPI0032EEAD37